MALKMEAALGILMAGLLFGLQADPTLAKGVALLQSGDAGGAVNVLKAVTSREPRNGRAWRNLGVAYQQAKDPDDAIAAFQRAQVQPEMAAPLYSIWPAFMRGKQDADHTFEPARYCGIRSTSGRNERRRSGSEPIRTPPYC